MAEQIISNYKIITTNELVDKIRNAVDTRYCFILGAGASVESEIRTGKQLGYVWMKELEEKSKFEKLKKHSDEFIGDEEITNSVSDIIDAYNEAKKDNKTTMPSEYYFDIYYLRFYEDFDEGYRALEKEMEKGKPSFGYHPLALMLTNKELGNNLVITINFDNLIEEALFIHANKHPIVINHESMVEFAKGNIRNRPIIAKIHRGLYYKPFNTQKKTNKLKDEWRQGLKSLFKTFTPIVIGYGGGDRSLMSLLEEEGLAEKIYWCYRESSGLPDERVQRLIQRKQNGNLVKTDGFDALMLAIGNEFFKDEIDPGKVRKDLLKQAEERANKHNERYNDLMKKSKEIRDKSTTATESQKEFVDNFVEVDKTVQESDKKREEKGEPLTAWDYLRMGNRALDEGKYDEAIEYYSKAIELDSDFAEAYYNRGNAYAMKGDHDQAIAEYSKAIALNPDLAEAYNNRGTAYQKKGDHDQAIANYNKAMELKPDDEAAYYNRGNAYDDKGDHDQAIADYSKAIELKPDFAEAYYNRGYAYVMKGDHDQAIADYNKAIELKPDLAKAYYNRGNAYDDKGEYDQAIADYSKAIELQPYDAEAYNNRGTAYYAKGDHDQAIADYSKAIELKPDYAFAYNNRGIAYALKGDHDQAIADYNKAIELKPDYADAYNNRGVAYALKGDHDQAIANFCKAIELKPDYAEAYNNRGVMYWKKGDHDKAQADFKKAAELREQQNN